MKTKQANILTICNQVTLAAQAYQKYLVGRAFLYVFGNEYIEVLFRVDDFFHLTGLASPLRAKGFYDNARNSKLTQAQIFFKAKHPYDLVKRKLPCLIGLDELTKRKVTVLKDMKTHDITYKMGLTNVSFTVGMYYKDGYYSPQTLRVKDKSLERSHDAIGVDFIFSKKYGENLYNTLLFSEKEKKIPEDASSLLAPEVLSLVNPSAAQSTTIFSAPEELGDTKVEGSSVGSENMAKGGS